MTSGASPSSGRTSRPALVWSALWVVYIVWGSTYLAIRVVVRTMPALGSMGARFLLAAALLAAVVVAREGLAALRVTRPQLAAAALVGVLLLTLGNGGVAVGEQTVPSGLAALLVAAMPLWLVLLRVVGRDRPAATTAVGTAVGFSGIAVLARPGGHGGEVEMWGVLTVLGATVCWATGTFLSQRLPLPPRPFVATVYEMTAGGLAMVILSPLLGELDGFTWGQVEPQAWWALGYLVVIGSLLAFTAFVWLVGHAPLSLVSTYAYVNPLVAVILGWALLAEPVTAAVLGGGALAVLGVFLVVRGERTPPPPR